MLRIAMDGPSGAGKSTLAKICAGKLGILHLDTGAMYRALGFFALENAVSPSDESAVAALLPLADVRVELRDGAQRTLLGGRDVTKLIRTQAVSKAASDIAVLRDVRVYMVERQRMIARDVDVVMDGRDIGTFVLPDADYKFFITATPQERARRRYAELLEADRAAKTQSEIEREIRARDHTDMHRSFAPLTLAPDACVIDTTKLTIEEAVEMTLKVICSK